MTKVDDPPTDALATDGSEPDESKPDAGGRRRLRLVWLGPGVVLATAVGAGVWSWVARTSTEATPATTGPVATATVERGTISAAESWDGTLGNGTPFTVSSGTEGTVTRLAGQGETIERGDVLLRVDEQPVTVMYGVVPMYRDLEPGAVGADVEQLQANLAELGYDGFRVDGEYTTSTADAVRAWQRDVGAEPTGAVARGDVVFVPGGGRVETLHIGLGAVVGPGAPILDVTGSDQFVSLEVDVDDRDRFEVDDEVTVVVAGGDEITGSVSAVAIVEPDPESTEDPMSADDTEPTAQVEIALNENAPDELIGAPVEVVVAVDERTDVLLVPVNALLALAEGGYGLEVVAEDGTTSLVPVETGLFASGQVEITSADVAEGTVVGVAGR